MEETSRAFAPSTATSWQDLWKRYEARIAVALLFLITIPMLTKIFTSDFGTHIALGRHIVRTHSLPTPEVWNYPSLGMENGSGGEWGFEAILYLVYSVGGVYGVSLMMWAVVLGIFVFLHRAIVRRGADPIVATLAIFAFSGFLRIRIQPRPEIFTYLFTALTIYLLTEYYFGGRKRILFLFPAVILVWSNMHPTYLMAFLLCGGFFADALIRAAWRKQFQWEALKGWIGPPLIYGALGLIVCGLNPHGYGWLLSPLHLISREGGSSQSVLMSISELTPVKGTSFYLYYKAAAAFAIFSIVLGAIGRRVYLLDLFLFTIAFKGAWDSARAVSMMGLFLSPGSALHFTGFLDRLKVAIPRNSPREKKDTGKTGKAKAKGRKKKGKGGVSTREGAGPSPSSRLRWRSAAGGVVVIALFVFGGANLSFSFSQLEYGIGITNHKFSFAAAEFLRKNPIPGNMFNFFDIGGFLDWQLYPEALTFIDGRAYNRKVFMEHQIVTGALAGWQEILNRYRVNYIVTKSIDSSGMVLPLIPALWRSPDWSLVFADGLFVIFVRNTSANRDYIKRHEISKSLLPQHVIWESYHYLFLGVSPVVVYQTMSNMYETMGNRRGAIESLRKALEFVDEPYLRARLRQLEQGSSSR